MKRYDDRPSLAMVATPCPGAIERPSAPVSVRIDWTRRAL